MTRIVVGTSEATEAEYGSCADAAATLLILIDNEVASVEGFSTLKAAIAAAKAEDCKMEVL